MASKLDLDIDDLLDDIVENKKPAFGRIASPSTSAKPSSPAPPVKKSDGFDDFYDDEPISEANVSDIAKSVDTDKMDNKLFGKKQESSPALFHAASADFNSTGKSSTGGMSDKTVIEKPMSAPGIRTAQPTPATSTAKTGAFDDFEVDSLLPVEAAPNPPKPASAQGALGPSSSGELPVKSSSLPLPDSKSGMAAGKTSMDLSSSGEFSSSSYLPSTGPTRSAFGAGKSVSFADDRPPTRPGKKLDTDYGGSDWLELAGGGTASSAGGGRASALDDILNATTSRRPGTSVTPAGTNKLDLNNKPKSAPGGLDLDGESHRASQARGPSAGSAYSLMKSERDDEHAVKLSSTGGLAVLYEKDESTEKSTTGAPTPPANLLNTAGSTGSASTLGTPDIRVGSSGGQRGSRTVPATSILLDPDVDIFSSTGEFNPLRTRRPTSSESDQGMAVPGGSGQTTMAPPRQGTPPGTTVVVGGLPGILGDALGADASAVSELTRLVQLHNRESQLSSELAAVRRHMDVNRLYLQRILGSVFGLETALPPSSGSDQDQQKSDQKQQEKQAFTTTSFVDQSRVQDFESELARLRIQINLLENIRDTLQTQHEQELEVVRRSYQRQIDEVEQATRHKEERLKSALNDATDELEATRKRHADELTEKALSHKSEIERFSRERDEHIRQMSNHHRQEMIELRRAHEEQVELLRAERRADAAAAGAAPELKMLADHLAELESNVNQRHESSMSLKMVMFSDREAQLRTQEAALVKEREQIRQALIQLEQAKNELQHQRWVAEQKEAKLTAMQEALEEERKRLSESSERDRAHLDKMRGEMMEEHGKLLSDIFRDRQRLAQESEHVEAEHRRLIAEKAELQRQQTVSNQTIFQARQAEEKMQAETSKLLADREKLLLELRVLDEERISFGKVRLEVEEMRRAAESKLREVEMWAMKSQEDKAAAEAIRSEVFDLKQEISAKQTAINEAQSAFIEEQNKLNKDRAELDQLRRSFVCSRCNSGVPASDVRRVMIENSDKYVDIRQTMDSLEQKLTADLHETKAERDTNNVTLRNKPKRTVRHQQKAHQKDEFDYEAERAWLNQLHRFRIQQSTFP